MNSQISVIVPVYNGESYIERCIDSIINQAYTNWELIVVNDGSTDKTVDILKQYNNNKIKIHHQKNKGVSEARNLGLSYATGDYIAFIDADDIIDKSYLSDLVSGGVNSFYPQSPDLIISGFCYENQKIKLPFIGIYDKERISKELPKMLNSDFFYYVWGKLFKREIIEKSNLNFDKKLRLGEDHLFNWSFLLLTNEIHYVDTYSYHKLPSYNSGYNLSLEEIDYLDKHLVNQNKLLEAKYNINIKQREDNICHLKFLNDKMSYKVSTLVTYYLKYSQNNSVAGAYNFISQNIIHPILNKARDKELRDLNNFIDKPFKLFWFSTTRTKYFIPLIKLHLYPIACLLIKLLKR